MLRQKRGQCDMWQEIANLAEAHHRDQRPTT